MNEKFAGWNILFLQYLKRDWRKIIIWVLGLGLFAAAFVPLMEEFARGEGLMGIYETLQNPAMISMVGPTPVERANDYSLGAMYSHMMLLFSSLFAMIISMLHLVGHTRGEEDSGLVELIRSFQVGRQANSLAVLVEIICINILLSLFISGLMISFGTDTISTSAAFLFGISIGVGGIIGSGIGLIMAQIMPSSSASKGSSLGIIGFLYIVRGLTDISNPNLSMANPIGWTYLTYPFTENNWMPIILGLVFSIIMIVIAFILEGNRDLGSGYLPERQGRANAKKSLLSVHGLFIRLNKGVIIAWLIGFLVLGIAYGTVYGDIETFVESNDLIQEMFSHSGVSLEESFTTTVIMVMISLITILPIVIVNKLFAEEKSGRLNQIYGTRVKRSQLYFTNIILAVLTAIIAILLASGSLGIVAISLMETSSMDIFDFLAIGYNLLPSVVFVTSLSALILGWIPRMGRLVYLYQAYSFTLNYLEGILDLPKLLTKISPQSWLPKVPMEDFDTKAFVLVTLVSIVLMIIGSIGYNKRDMVEGD